MSKIFSKKDMESHGKRKRKMERKQTESEEIFS
jgi:hypothetical protein